MIETGLRIHSVVYAEKLFATHIAKIFPLVGSLVVNRIKPIVDKFYKRDFFVTRVLDEQNLGVCRGAFLMNQSINIGVALSFQDDDLTVSTVGEESLTLHAPKGMRGVFKSIVEEDGKSWEEYQEHIAKVVEYYYQDEFVLLRATPENAKALRQYFESDTQFDLRIRVKA